MFVVASGSLRVYVRNREGHNEQVRMLHAGEFFGEISLITGQPRTATVTAASRTELLALDLPTLNKIAADHPQVPETIREFYRQRFDSPEERTVRQ